MNRDELAKLLDGREYGNETDKHVEKLAKAAGLVIVYGSSDDLMEFRGAVDEELSAFEGTTASLTNTGLLTSKCEAGDECPYFAAAAKRATPIDAVWSAPGEPAWTFKTDVPEI